MNEKAKDHIYSIYEEEIDDLSYTPQTLFEKLFYNLSRKISLTSNLKYTFSIPVSDFLRGEVFCNDVSEAMESDFNQRDLISILLDDFLYQAKRRSNPYDLYHSLNEKSGQEIHVHCYDKSSEVFVANKDTQRIKKIECMIKRSEALRLEVMLSDITDLRPDTVYTVEDVLRILYCDFILKYKTGKLSNVLENIIKRLSKNA